MKYLKRITFLLLFIIPVLSFGQGREVKPNNAPPSDKGHRNVWDEKGRKQGVHKQYSSMGFLLYEVEYVNNKKHGLSLKYYASNGKLREECTYFDGRREGEYKKMYFSGNTNTEGEYLDGKRHGYWTKYSNLTTEVVYEGNYDLGNRTGEWKYYNSKGQLKAKGSFIKGKKEGVWEYYDALGKVAFTKVFKNDEEYVEPPATNDKKGGAATPKK